MTLIQALLRRVVSQPTPGALKSPTPLQPELFKSVSGGEGETQSPYRSW